MRRTRNVGITVALSLCSALGPSLPAASAPKEPVEHVDPFIGTGYSRWMLFPGATMPFGMVKLSPDTQDQGYYGGYEYDIENVAGFSHIHSYAMAGLLTMPTTGELQVNSGPEDDPDRGYRSRFSHAEEIATPGYYAVTLKDYDIRAELTATTRAGFQRYTFPEAEQAHILFDLKIGSEHGYQVLNARVRKVSDTEIEGFVKQQARMSWVRWSEYTVHFVARFSKPFESFGGWRGERIYRVPPDRSSKNQKTPDTISGEWNGDIGAFVRYTPAAGEQVLVQTGISLVSIHQARLNMQTELAPFA